MEKSTAQRKTEAKADCCPVCSHGKHNGTCGVIYKHAQAFPDFQKDGAVGSIETRRCLCQGNGTIKKPISEVDINEARAHLGAALAQTIEKDDPIIMGHVRDAYHLLGGV